LDLLFRNTQHVSQLTLCPTYSDPSLDEQVSNTAQTARIVGLRKGSVDLLCASASKWTSATAPPSPWWHSTSGKENFSSICLVR
jgi:hypothetical protein